MTWDPRLILMRAELSHDLGRVQAWCQFKHPELPSYTLIAAAKYFEALGVAMEISVAEIERNFATDALISTAIVALTNLGYFADTVGARWTSPGTLVFAADLTAHEKIAAVRNFRELGLW